MHEMALTQSLLDIALRKGQEAGARRVAKIHVQIGKLACVTSHAMRFCFSELAKNTLAQDAQLVFTYLSAQGLCHTCGMTFAAESYLATCPRCQSSEVIITGGDALMVNSIEVDLCA